MSSNQKVVQLYLEKNGIGQLFEDMMAKLIRDMPNEPLPYLMKILQNVYHKKMPANENTLPVSGFCAEMGLVGSSIPKKFSKDPQVILPGSKQPVSSWATNDLDSVISEDVKGSKSRVYEKPWQANSKPLKGGREKKGPRDEYKSWDTDTKGKGNTFDDLFEQQNGSRKNPLSKSMPVTLNEAPRQRKGKGHSWSEESSYDKENKPPYRQQPIRMAADDNDELKVDTSKNSKKMTISPAAYSKFKKQNSKKKSLEQKQKLQALLSSDKTKTNKRNDDESSDDNDDEVEVMEDKADLAGEGANSKTSVGVKRSIHKTVEASTDVKVSVCPRCAKLVDGNASYATNNNGLSDSEYFFNPKSKNSFESVNSDDDDFDSVSQINTNVDYRPKWPTITDSEGEDVEHIAKLSLKDPPKKNTLKKGVNFQSGGAETDKSDFFETNSPLRKKTKQAAKHLLSDNESGVELLKEKKSPSHRSSPLRSRSPPKQAWKQQAAETESDAEIDDIALSRDTKLKARGWKQKQPDDASDVL